MKRWEIITYQYGIYDLPHVFPNDFKLSNLGNEEILGKCLNFIKWRPSGQSPCQNKNFVSFARKSQEIAI